MSDKQDTPYGYCQCGCGEKTIVSPHTDRSHGWTKNEPRRFVAGHNNRLRRAETEPADRGFETACEVWLGKKNDRGYGLARWTGSAAHLAHRILWEIENGPVPDGMELDHLCRQRDCVSLAHLELVTHKENMRRASVVWAARDAHKDGSGIKAIRAEMGWTQGDVADVCGVSRSLVSLWETGQAAPQPHHRDRIKEAVRLAA